MSTTPARFELTPEISRAVLAIAGAAGHADGVDPIDEAALLAVQNHPDEVTAYVYRDGFWLRHGNELAVVVSPDQRGQGIGTALLAQAVDDAANHDVDEFTMWMHGDSPAARALASRAGFIAARELWVMRRATIHAHADGLEPLTAPEPPAGVTLRAFEPGDEAEILRVNLAAFSWHPEQGAMDAANLAERMSQPWFSPADLITAWEGDRLLGFHWTKRHSETLSEIYVVGVDPEAQGRGLGRLLTLAGMAHMENSGAREIHLYVESDNVPAVKLYQSLQFTHAAVDTHVQFLRNRLA